jgi:nucleoside phosphorylase
MVDPRVLLTADNGATLARHLIEFDPRSPEHYLFSAPPGHREAVARSKQAYVEPIPWPAGLGPETVLPRDAQPEDPLPQADVLVVTYTVAEGYALADVLSPGTSTTAWVPYRNGWDALKPLIHGMAPSRGYDRAGLWMTTQIGSRRVVLFKSDLHPSTDGVQLPIANLWQQIIDQVKPKLVITTGTAGGVGATTRLGDVIVTQKVRWDCMKTFAHSAFAHDDYVSDFPLASSRFAQARTKLMPVNASRLPDGATYSPVIVHGTKSRPANTISTDFFAFDDAKDHYGLRAYDGKARAVEMDDAALGLVCSQMTNPPGWVSVRNASDPQMDEIDLVTETKKAAAIYEQYGYITSIGSAITCWALIAGMKG